MIELLKQAKDMFVAFFGIAGLMLALVFLIMIIIIERTVWQSWRGFVVRAKA